jgi:RNA polymerase sigma-32 factor
VTIGLRNVQIGAIEEGDLTPEHVATIAEELDVPTGDVVSMNRRMMGRDHSLNAPLRADGDSECQDALVDESASQETSLADRQESGRRRGLLRAALTHLDERERDIIAERRLSDVPSGLGALEAKYGISRERVRQIEVRAFEKLQKAMRCRHRPLHAA